ncbi:MAG: phosphate/phosphite/phosphonate ABC transporter substrate-binding protein [Bdellovibrionia bacterium]
MSGRIIILSVCLSLGLVSCTTRKDPLGSEKNPVKLHFVPSVEAKVLEDNSKKFKAYLEKATPYKFKVTIPQSYITVVEAFGTKRADISALNSFGYVLAHERFGAEARITVLRHGSAFYQSQILAHVDSGIEKLEDLNGRKIAFVDPASMSGYLLPLKTILDKGIKPKETVFAMKHDSVITMMYQKQVEAGATFYSPPDNGQIEDARRLVLRQYPDVVDKIKIIALTEQIPNDPIVFRKDMPEEMKTTIINAFMDYIKTDEGKAAFKAIYGVTDLKLATDADYTIVRQLLTQKPPTPEKEARK